MGTVRASRLVGCCSALALAVSLSVTHAQPSQAEQRGRSAAQADSGSLAIFFADSASGKTLRRVSVSAHGPYWWKGGEDEAGARTDSTGWAHLDRLETGNYRIWCCGEGYRPETIFAFVRVNSIDSIRVRLAWDGSMGERSSCGLWVDLSDAPAAAR